MNEPSLHRGYFVAWRTDDFLELLRTKPNAFRLLALIAYRARWRDGYSGDGLERGEARLGRFDVQRELGLTPKEYRLACDTLEQGKFVALQRTHHGTVARIVDSRVFSPTAPQEGTPKGTEKGTPRAHEGHTEGHKEERKNAKKEKNEERFEIPLLLNTEAFREAWATWCQHLRERRKPIAATAARLQLDKLAAMGEAAWLEICPAEFVAVDRRLLPDCDLFDRVQQWQFGARGLVLAAETGLGKTRAAYALLYREFMAGRSVQVVTPYALAGWPYLVLNEPKQADTLIRRIIRADIFFADDPLKSRLTPTVEELLFTALDERTSRKRPCFLTFNDSGATIMEQFSTDRAKAFLRRIRDFCDVLKPTPCTTP